MTAAVSSKEVLKHYRQILKRVNKSSSSMHRQQGLKYMKEMFRAGASMNTEADEQTREQLVVAMRLYLTYLKDFDSYTDLMQMYRVGQHDTPLQDILRSTAKRVGFDLDMTYEESQKRRQMAMEQEMLSQVKQE